MKQLLFILLFILPISLQAQDRDASKGKFPAFNLGVGGSDKKNKNWGNYHFDNGLYSKALKSYEKIGDPDAETLRNMAYAYEFIDEVEKAVESYNKIFAKKVNK